MTYADLSDVRVYDRELGPDDEVFDWVDTLLGQAERRIRVDFPDLDARVSDGRSPLELVVQVEAEMVAGVTRNPQAWTNSSENIGGLSEGHGFNLAAASGLLEFTERQRAMIAAVPTASSAGGGAFTIRQRAPRARCR